MTLMRVNLAQEHERSFTLVNYISSCAKITLRRRNSSDCIKMNETLDSEDILTHRQQDGYPFIDFNIIIG